MRRFVLSVFLAFIAIAFAVAQPPVARVTPERMDAQKDIQVFPNPAVEYVHVKVESVKAEKIKLTLHNILGSEMPVETEVVNEHELRVWVKDLSSGYYFLALKEDESGLRRIYKIIKK